VKHIRKSKHGKLFSAGSRFGGKKFTSGFSLIGAKIIAIRRMTNSELSGEGWGRSMHEPSTALVLDNGAVIYASSDPEGNNSGELFGTRGGKGFYVMP
jgi:hypothetical protein